MRGPTPIAGHVTLLIRACAFAARVLARAVTRVRIEGEVDSIPRSGPVILAANHTSNADPVVIGGFLTQTLNRRVNWLGKKELFQIPIFGWLCWHGGIHPVDRGAAEVDAFKLARKILVEGHLLAVFPEGTRSPNGTLQAAKDGIALLAIRTGAPVIPIGIEGADRVWPKGRKLPRLGGHITIRIGAPIVVEASAGGAGRRAAKSEATEHIMRAIAALLPERQRGVYGASDSESVPPSPEVAGV